MRRTWFCLKIAETKCYKRRGQQRRGRGLHVFESLRAHEFSRAERGKGLGEIHESLAQADVARQEGEEEE